jgi:hypothetical protein
MFEVRNLRLNFQLIVTVPCTSAFAIGNCGASSRDLISQEALFGHSLSYEYVNG